MVSNFTDAGDVDFALSGEVICPIDDSSVV